MPANINYFRISEPRIGNLDAGVSILGLGWSNVYRAVNYDDIIAHMPFQWLVRRHHRREGWILADGTSVVTCGDGNSTDNENKNCLTSVGGTSISSHGVNFRSNC
ncbi:hypothetical protein BJ742DRAFT_774424 [Cladochytrium replicatum]|nr:hypothetical protein BJ742DRAFT_774424 [Cladochytrium replicatum]